MKMTRFLLTLAGTGLKAPGQNLPRLLRLGLPLALTCCLSPAFAATVTLTNSDTGTASAFLSGTNWSDGQLPSSANDYYVGSGMTIRTPANNQLCTFGGNSLTLAGTFSFKQSNVVTINNLTLTNGTIVNAFAGGTPNMGRLAGTINVVTNGIIDAGGNAGAITSMQIQSAISGSGGLTIQRPSVVTLTAANTYTGSVSVVGSTLQLAGTASLTPSSLVLQIGSSMTNNMVTNIVQPGGRLNVGYGPAGVLRVGYRTSSPATNCTATLDVSSQSQFTVNVGEFSIGTNQVNDGFITAGNVFLATNNTVTATNILIADSGITPGATSVMVLGSGSNYFSTPVMTVGARKSTGRLTLPAGGVFCLDNAGGPATLTVGGENFSTSASATGTLDASGGTMLATLGTLNIGLKAGGSTGGATGTMTLSSNAANNLSVSALVIGSLSGATSGSPAAQGTLTMGGGNLSVSGNVTMGSFDNGSGSATGTLNLNGGTLSIGGNLVNGGGTNILNLNGGIVNMQNGSNVTATVLSGSGQITNAGTVTVLNSLTPGGTNGAGTLAVSTLNLSSGTALYFNLNSNAVSGATKGILQVNGDLTLGTEVITVKELSLLAPGTYCLVSYTGSLLNPGSLSLVAPANRQSFALDTSTRGQINLVVTGNPISLLWSGDGSANTWDVGSSGNWNAGSTVFYQGDYVTFDDSGSASPAIWVDSTVQPASMVVSNTTKSYVFNGAGISTSGSLIKRGNNVAALTSPNNNFTGPISIESGTLSIGNGGSFGSLGSGPITNNGQLLLNMAASGTYLAGPISGSGSLRLTGGGGSLGLGGSNSFTGGTTIESGCQLNIFNNNALGSTNGQTVVQSGGSVRFTSQGNWTVAEPLEINGFGLTTSAGALYANTVSNNATWTGPITVGSPSQIRIVNGNVRMTLAGPVTANQQALQATANDSTCLLTFQNTLSLGTDPALAAFTKDGSGTVVLAGKTNISGSTTVNGGTLLVTTLTQPQIGPVTVSTGTLQVGSGDADGSLPTGAINLSGTGTLLAINSSNTFVMNSQLSGQGSLSLLNYGKLIINSSNTFTGGITTGSGTPTFGGAISLFNSYGLGDGTAPKTVRLVHAALLLQGGLDIPGAISFATSSGASPSDAAFGVAQVIQNVSGNNTIEGNITPTSGAGNSEFTVLSGTLTLKGTISPDITNRTVILSGAGNGVLNGALTDNGLNIPALTKQGAGTWTLNNANTYSGLTTIQNGTLALGPGASLPNTPAIVLASNALLNVSAVSGGFTLGSAQTLSGSGNVAGNVTALGAVTPGPLATLNFANSLVLAGSTTLELNRTNAQTADLIAAANLTFGGTLTVTNAGPDLQAGDTFNLFDGALSGAFTATNLPALASTNLHWDVSLLNSQGIIKVVGNTPPPPRIAQPGIGGGNLTLTVDSQSGFNYVLEVTPSLSPANWTGIQTNAGGGTLTFFVPVSAANPQRFCRIRVQ